METKKTDRGSDCLWVDFSVRSEYYDAIFSISLVGRHFALHVMKPDKPDKKDNWMINGFPYLLVEENLSKVIREAEAYFARQVEPVEKKVGSTESNSEVKPSTPSSDRSRPSQKQRRGAQKKSI